jgi:hypothetical protein
VQVREWDFPSGSPKTRMSPFYTATNRGCSLLEEMSVLPPLFGLSYIFEVAYSTMYGDRVLVMRKTTLRIFDEVKEQKRC